MKMKEVMRATNLPEKTIRYYEERGLVTPETYRQNRRTYHDYSEEDVEVLRRIVILRQARFTLDEIYTMEHKPDTIPAIVKTHHNRIRKEQDSLAGLLSIGAMEVSTLEELCREIREIQEPDYEPVLRFGQNDPESQSEKESTISAYKRRQGNRLSGWQITVICLSVLCAMLLCSTIWLLVMQMHRVPLGAGSTEGWTYYMSQRGIMRVKEGEEPECIYERQYNGSVVNFLMDSEKLYVMDDGTLFSVNADGSGKHIYRPKFGSEYDVWWSGGYYGQCSVFLLYEDDLYVAEQKNGGMFTGSETTIVRVPTDGGKQEALNLDLQGRKPGSAAIWQEKLYLFLLGDDAETLEVMIYDLKTDAVLEQTITEGSRCYYFDDTTGYTADSVGGSEGYSSTIYQISPDDLGGTRVVTLDGELVAIYDHYALYLGDFKTYGDENSSWMESGGTYLYNLETGNQIPVDGNMIHDWSLNWTETGLRLTGTFSDEQWYPYPE
ncbi:MAG: MerR family transcriptional regulator [Oscillospiraceae bacterium]|nr:MerR family transcriptional regulator [Oscillospiraceae bacterium]